MNEIHSFKKIIKDLGDNLKSNKKNMKQVSDDYYLYDRIKFVSKYHDKDRDIDTSYFSGNQPTKVSLQACFSKKKLPNKNSKWTTILKKTY